MSEKANYKMATTFSSVTVAMASLDWTWVTIVIVPVYGGGEGQND